MYIISVKAEIVTEFIIEGNSRVNTETIQMFSGIAIGDDVNETTLNESLKNLYDTNFFSNIEITFDNSVVKIKLNENPIIQNQRNKVSLFEDDLNDIYNSRTFCLYEDLKKLEKLGLGKGGSLENAVVVKDSSILNKEGLRNNLEFVNHKILDCMGDLYLSGYRIIGSIKCSQGGHSLTNKLLRKLFADKINYSLIEIKGNSLPHSFANRSQLRSIA
ncbi:MAG: UDP-3-O-acyl-N-acetylglucosamine deacetylase [Candidatus Pelagibacter ubique]